MQGACVLLSATRRLTENENKPSPNMTDEEKIHLLRSALKDALEKLQNYAKRQGKRRMAGRSFGDGTVSNPQAGQHYPAVNSSISYSKAALMKTA